MNERNKERKKKTTAAHLRGVRYLCCFDVRLIPAVFCRIRNKKTQHRKKTTEKENLPRPIHDTNNESTKKLTQKSRRIQQ